MDKKIKFLLILTLVYLPICYGIYSKYRINIPEKGTLKVKESIKEPQKNDVVKINQTKKDESEKPIGTLVIPKINLNENLYSLESKNNNIEKHVTILNYSDPPGKENGIIFIAAHSGTGKIAYFKSLNKLSVSDEIILTYHNKTYTYKVKSIWEEKKAGTITVPKESTKQLILTTCSPNKNNYQLIINCVSI